MSDLLAGSGRWRRAFAVVVTVVAAAASVATSSDPAMTSATPVSGRVTLSQDRPEVRIPFVVEGSEEALTGRLSVFTTTSSVWVGVSDEVAANGPDLSIETPAAVARPEAWEAADGRMVCGQTCLGASDLVLRWPAEVTDGSVTIAWTIDARVEFETGEPPEGSEVTLEVESPPEEPAPVATWPIETGGEQPMVVANVQVESAGPLSPGPLSLQRPGHKQGAATVQVKHSGVWSELPAGTGVALMPPSECERGPCSFEVPMVASVAPMSSGGGATFELVAPNAGGTLTAALVESQPWISSSARAETTVSLDSDAAIAAVPVSIELEGETDGAQSVFWVTYSVELTEYDPEDVTIGVSSIDRSSGYTGGQLWVRADDEARTSATGLSARCDGSRCIGEMDLQVSLRQTSRDSDESAAVRIAIDAVLLSPTAVAKAEDLVMEIGSAR